MFSKVHRHSTKRMAPITCPAKHPTTQLTTRSASSKTPPGGKGRKLSQAELVIQQYRAKQQAQVGDVSATGVKGTSQSVKSSSSPQSAPGTSTAKKIVKKKPSKPKDDDGGYDIDENGNAAYEKPLQQPSKEFLKGSKPGKLRLPTGMTIDQLNQMSPEVIAKTLNIDMSILESLRDDRDDEYTAKFSEDETADSAPPQEFKPDAGQQTARYTPTKIATRHTINMMPTVTPRDNNFKGRVTVIRKLPPHFENVHKNVRKFVRTMMKLQKLTHFDLAVTLVSAQGMQYINKQHRYVDSPTDVLAFPMEEPYCEGIPVELGNIADLGEIILCVPYIYAQAAIRHGMLRELGYDLSDSKRPLNDVEKLQKLFNNIGDIRVNSDGSLSVRTSTNIDIEGSRDDVVDGSSLSSPLPRVGSLPSITLSAPQLDKLPPFDRDHILNSVAQAREQLTGVPAHLQLEAQNKQSQTTQLKALLETQDVSVVHKFIEDSKVNLNNSASSGGNNTLASPNELGQMKGSDDSLSVAAKWTLSQGFPPPNYFKYITEAMVIDEMNIVLLHGFLHLCGYDHDTNERRRKMQDETDRMVTLLLQEGAISQRCADLAALYVLDEVDESAVKDLDSEDEELIPAGMLLDREDLAKQATEEEIQKMIHKSLIGRKTAKSNTKSPQTKPKKYNSPPSETLDVEPKM